MIRLLHLPLLSAAAAAILTVTTLLPAAPPGTPTRPVNHIPLLSPSPNPGPCNGCVQPLDTLCWEGPPRCTVVVVRVPPRSNPVTVHYRTVAMTAHPGIDYVGVSSGTLYLQPNQASAEITIQLIPNPGLTEDRKFGVELFGVTGAGMVRPMATVTIRPSPR
ncbi:hypothetical protein Cme02nite_03850 [Catellatospora methionotrophica]|uniref:Calx-beta domain-containing protein n=1 Tax=Catellatospora methionotrophica TaxID=121620 RepID=A0A8J3L0B4_9ACTN|nr:Calx-beta domain-containing protein [Catellatospora methionotrophica]GIG12053.1 hypothetical protein Cme02nite_03850 [Catellatospora methionotrophica]